jgi:hypothetical protein
MVFRVITLCGLLGVTAILEELVDSIFSIDGGNRFLQKCG